MHVTGTQFPEKTGKHTTGEIHLIGIKFFLTLTDVFVSFFLSFLVAFCVCVFSLFPLGVLLCLCYVFCSVIRVTEYWQWFMLFNVNECL